MGRDGVKPQDDPGVLRGDGHHALTRLYSLRDAATYLGISYWTVRELINRQEMPAVRIGRRVMVDVADLNRFIEANKSRAEIF